jgi:hypothetical protein
MHALSVNGQLLPFTVPSSFCGCSPLSGHSLEARNRDTVELTDRGTKRPFVTAAPMSELRVLDWRATPYMRTRLLTEKCSKLGTQDE